jgi:serine phosphatase RsbU (regulator of sigma subunit)
MRTFHNAPAIDYPPLPRPEPAQADNLETDVLPRSQPPRTNSKQTISEASPAFREALLKSELLRIRIILATILAGFAIRTVRTAILYNDENVRLWLVTCLLTAIFAIYELGMYRALRRVAKAGRDLPRVVWIANVVVETSLPAVALVLLTDASIAAPYRPLANPVVLLYFVFIILSILRLDPAICRISGLVAAASYLWAASKLGWAFGAVLGASLLSPQKTVIGFALTFLVSGFVAGAIAAELRKQVSAALREADARRQVERFEHDLEIARSIQQSLLPRTTPEIDGFEIAGWNLPADQTGGDYYDWQLLPDGRLIVALADVTGHGIGPALLAAVCRAYARAHFRADCGLLSAMTQLNSALANDIGEGRFVTFVAAVCCPGSSRLELLSAGHGPLFRYLLREDRFDEMSAQGIPLGLIPELNSEPPAILDLSSGDLLILATDGFFEWANPEGEQFGKERLERSVREARQKSPAEIIALLYQAVVEFSRGTKQEDDLTAVVIRRK